MLEGHWYIASPSRELRRKPLAVTMLGRPLVLFRADQGRPAALEDRCAHRNAPLSAGSVCDGRLQCAYHGWCYGADGCAAVIPAQPQGCMPEPLPRVTSHACLEQDGYVWVSPSSGGSPAADAPMRFPFLGQPGWTSFCMRKRFHAPVEACLENFLDCPHAAHVHRLWFRTPQRRPVRAVVRTLADGAEAEYFGEPRESSLVWWLLAPKSAGMRHTDRYIAPTTSRVDYVFDDGSHYVITSSCTPIGEVETEVHTVISFRFGRLGPLIRLLFEPLSQLIIHQDMRMLARTQRNIERFGGPRFRVLSTDLLMPHIQRWRQALKTRAVPPAAGAEQHVDLVL